jgi:hypothetical protein
VTYKDLCKVTGQEDINIEKKKKIEMVWPHIKKRGRRGTKSCPILEPSRKQEERKTEE